MAVQHNCVDMVQRIESDNEYTRNMQCEQTIHFDRAD